MNANELPAEQLAQWCDEASQEYGNKPLVQVATMLRQQQAEIEALKAKTLTDEEIDDFTARIYNCRTGAEAHKIVLAILRKAQEL